MTVVTLQLGPRIGQGCFLTKPYDLQIFATIRRALHGSKTGPHFPFSITTVPTLNRFIVCILLDLIALTPIACWNRFQFTTAYRCNPTFGGSTDHYHLAVAGGPQQITHVDAHEVTHTSR